MVWPVHPSTGSHSHTNPHPPTYTNLGRGQKKVYLVRSGPKTGPYLNQVEEAPTSPAVGLQRIVPIFLGQRVHRSCRFRLTFNSFYSFFGQSAIFHSFTLYPKYEECRRTGRPPTPSTSHTTPHRQHMCPPSSRKYVGIRMGGIGWNYRAPLWLAKTRQKTVEGQAE